MTLEQQIAAIIYYDHISVEERASAILEIAEIREAMLIAAVAAQKLKIATGVWKC